MERFTTYLQRRRDAGLDLEGTLLDVLDQTDFEPLTGHSMYCKANDSIFDNNDSHSWSFNMHETSAVLRFQSTSIRIKRTFINSWANSSWEPLGPKSATNLSWKTIGQLNALVLKHK
ncbi:LOW QUALITY PROTEIN: hypothetical protein JCM24511_04644 [Saitozyma sp. JCM 24511]|nr:LOW QUALITY PROTEIN: hypothetical protein JCM24511_04644 [Saitozyma sp. JCM 24511]